MQLTPTIAHNTINKAVYEKKNQLQIKILFFSHLIQFYLYLSLLMSSVIINFQPKNDTQVGKKQLLLFHLNK